MRQGAVLFGLGSLAYCLLGIFIHQSPHLVIRKFSEFITFFIIDLHPDCTDLLVSANSLLAILFIVLQTVVIVM